MKLATQGKFALEAAPRRAQMLLKKIVDWFSLLVIFVILWLGEATSAGSVS